MKINGGYQRYHGTLRELWSGYGYTRVQPFGCSLFGVYLHPWDLPALITSHRTLCHIFLFGTVICQWFPSGKTVMTNGISLHFPLLCVLNAIYVHLWADHHYIISFIFALFISFMMTVRILCLFSMATISDTLVAHI